MNPWPALFLPLLVPAAPAAPASPAAPVVSAPLTAVCGRREMTPLVGGGRAACILLIPAAEPYAALADGIRARLAERLGIELPTADEAGFMPDGRTMILYGNVFCGDKSRRLYANELIVADGIHPGSGHEVRTIPWALDWRSPVLFLGGSTPDGVLRSLDRLLADLPGGDEVTLAPRNDLRGNRTPRPTPPTDEQITTAAERLGEVLESFRDQPLYDAIGQMHRAKVGYQLTGDDQFGKLFAALLAPTVAWYRRTGEEPPTFRMAAYAAALDGIEESAGMSDDARLLGAEWLREVSEDTMRFWEMNRPIKRYTEQFIAPIWNHETFPCLSLAAAAQYLGSHYDLAAAEGWSAIAEHLFASQLGVDLPLEDSANYEWLVHRHMAEYVMMTGRLQEFFTGPTFRDHLAYAIGSHDSLGQEATHGDAGTPFGSSAGSSFVLGEAIYRNPVYSFLADRIGRANEGSLWAFGGSRLEPRPPGQIGLTVFTVDPARQAAFGIEGLPADRVLDKAILRGGWDRNDEYLMLDGLNVGNHKHVDGNAIICYVNRRRRWLTDMDYIRSAPKHHNSIAVTRDGLAPDQRPTSHDGAQVIAAPPYAAEVTGQAAGETMAIVQSTMHDYDGLDWTRNLFWSAGEGLVVIDELVAVTPGDYLTRCIWRTLGEVTRQGAIVNVEQAGEHRSAGRDFQLEADADRTVATFLTTDARLTFRQDLPAGKTQLRALGVGPNTAADSIWLRVDEEEPRYVGLTTGEWPAEDALETIALNFGEAGPHTFELTLRERPGARLDAVLLTLPDGTVQRLEAEDLVAGQVETIDEPEQHFFIANADGAGLHFSEQFDVGHPHPEGYYADYAYAGPMTQVIEQVQARQLAVGDRLVYANLLQFGEGQDAVGTPLRRLAENVWIAGGATPLLVALGPLNQDDLVVEAQATLVTPRGLTAVAAQSWAVAGVAGEAAPTRTLAETFDAPTAARVRERLTTLAAAAPLPPEPAIVHPTSTPGLPIERVVETPAVITALAGSESRVLTGDAAGGVTLFQSDGARLWSVPLGATIRTAARLERGADSGWAVGTGGGEVVLFGDDGTERWRYACQPYHGRYGSVATVFGADLDGDGAQEVVAGSDNWHYHAFDAGGKLLWRRETVHASTAGAAGDLTGDGREDVVAGTEYYWPRLISADGKEIGRASLGPVVRVAAALDLDGDGAKEAVLGAEDCFLYALKPGGAIPWRANLGGTPLALAVLPGATPRLAVGTDAHGLGLFDAGGQRRSYRTFPGPIRALATVGERLVAGCDDGMAYLLSAEGDLLGGGAMPAPPTALAAMGSRRTAAACGRWLVLLDLP